MIRQILFRFHSTLRRVPWQDARRMSGWATHVLDGDRLSAELRRALESGDALGTDLRNELSVLERRGPCPPGVAGWEFSAAGDVRRRCFQASDSAA